jgi:hypothetical protein
VRQQQEDIAVGAVGVALRDLVAQGFKGVPGERLEEQLERGDAGGQGRPSSTPATSRSRRINSCSWCSVTSISCAAPSRSIRPARIEIATWFR